MRQIVLIRHARVDIDGSKRIDAKALKAWVDKYNSAPIAADSKPSAQTINLAQNADFVVTSTLRRAIDSAHTLGLEINEKNELFNEANIPDINTPWIKLKAKTWLVVLRLMLFMKLGGKDVSLSVSKRQAAAAAKYLNSLSITNKKIVVVGHGAMNWLIFKILQKEGWSIDGKALHSNWGTTILYRS